MNLEAIINDWPAEWREPISVAEVSMGPPANAHDDPMRKYDQQYNKESSTETHTDPEAQKILNKL